MTFQFPAPSEVGLQACVEPCPTFTWLLGSKHLFLCMHSRSLTAEPSIISLLNGTVVGFCFIFCLCVLLEIKLGAHYTLGK